MTDKPEPVVLDWSKHTVEPIPMDGDGLSRAKRCRLCGKAAWMRDEHGRPCHKVCAEAEQTRLRDSTAEGRRSIGPARLVT